jgi:DNA-directed RNA polymerase specialized sigma subunit
MRDYMEMPGRRPQTITLPRANSPLNLFADDIDCAIQRLTAELGHVPSEAEIAEGLRICLTDYGQAMLHLKDRGEDAFCPEEMQYSQEEEVAGVGKRRKKGPLFPSRRAATQSVVPLAKKLFAPDIEYAIQLLTAKYGRAPTESEIAADLGISPTSYRQVLRYLKDLEIGTFFVEGRRESGEEEGAYFPNGLEEDPVFRCLRSEMQGLLTDAIQNLPEPERLVLSFRYEELLDEKSMSIVLNLPQSRVSELRAHASLTVRASLTRNMIGCGWKVVRKDEEMTKSLSSPQGSSDIEVREGAEVADIEVSGWHHGWVPTKLSRKLFGTTESWHRHFRSWYVINEKQCVTQVQRQERYSREAGC